MQKPRRRLSISVAACGLAVAHSLLLAPRTRAQETDKATPKREAARRFLEDLRVRQRIPGLSAAVALRGELVYAEGFGLADLEQNVKVTPATKFRIASLSKLVTAAALARSVEQGHMSLDDTVSQHVSYWPKKRWPIRLRQIAAHTSGIRHYRASDPIRTPKHYASVRAGIRIFADDALLFEPGSKYSYSSYAFNLLSATLEGAREESFLQILRKEVLEPLDMRETTADHRFRIIEKRARFYHLSGKAILNSDYIDSSYKWAGGGLLSTPRDLVKLGLAHCKPGYLAAATLGQVFTPQEGSKRQDSAYGIGWRISKDRAGRVLYHHGGAIEGGRGYLIAYPESQSCVVILANLKARFGRPAAAKLASFFLPE